MSVGKITKNASSLFVGKVVSSVLGFFTGALIARLLEPSELGLIGIAMSTITLIYIITDLGLNQAIIYLIPRLLKEESKGGVKHLINRVYGIKIVLGVAVMIFLYLSSEWLALLYNEPALGQVFRFFSILFVFFVVFNGLLNLFIAFQKMSYVTYSTIMLSISKFLPIALFFLAGFLGVVYGYVAMYAISALLTIVLLSRLYPKSKVVQKVALTELMKVSMGMFLMMLCYSLVSQASSLMLGLLSTATEVAYFNVSISIGLLVSFGGVALGSSMRPAITEMVSKGSKELVRRTLKYVVYGTLPITSLAIALGSPIIRFVYTEKYLPALPAYNWIVLSFGLTGLFIFLFDVARAIGRSFSVTKSYLLQAVVLIALNFLLVPAEGAVGAGKAFFISTAIGGVVILFEIRNLKMSYPMKALILSLISSGLMFLVVSMLWNVTYGLYKLVFLSATSLFVYLSAIYLMGGLDSEDIRLLKRFFSVVMKR